MNDADEKLYLASLESLFQLEGTIPLQAIMLQLATDKVRVISDHLICLWSQSRQKHGSQHRPSNALDPTLGVKPAERAFEAIADNVFESGLHFDK
jgi:hypothetical protein